MSSNFYAVSVSCPMESLFSQGHRQPTFETYGLGDVMGEVDKQGLSPFCVGRCIDRGHATHKLKSMGRGRLIKESVKDESCPYCTDALYYSQHYKPVDPATDRSPKGSFGLTKRGRPKGKFDDPTTTTNEGDEDESA